MPMIRAIIETLDQANHQANVRPIGAPASLLTKVPIAETCPTELLAADAEVLVAALPDGESVIISPYLARPTWPPMNYAFSAGPVTCTTGQNTLTALNLSIAHVGTCHFLYLLNFSAYANVGYGSHSYASIYCDGVMDSHVVSYTAQIANRMAGLDVTGRSTASKVAATNAITARVQVITAGHTLTVSNMALTVLTLPA